jgi:hypothetical protein
LAAGGEQAGEGGQQAGEHEGGHDHARGVDAGDEGRLPVASGGDEAPPERRVAEHELEHGVDEEHEQDRDGDVARDARLAGELVDLSEREDREGTRKSTRPAVIIVDIVSMNGFMPTLAMKNPLKPH